MGILLCGKLKGQDSGAWEGFFEKVGVHGQPCWALRLFDLLSGKEHFSIKLKAASKWLYFI